MRRLLHFLFAAAALACFFFCLYAMYWIWTIKKPALEAATRAFDSADKWLDIGDKTVEDVKGNLVAARFQVRQVDATPGAGGVKLDMMQKMIARSAINAINRPVNDMAHTMDKVTEASIVVNTILESLHDVPFEPADKLDIEQVRNLQTQVVGVTRASWELGNLLSDASTGDGESPAAKSARIAESLGEIIAMTNEFQQRVQALRKRLQQARGKTMFWLNNGPTYATIVLTWIAFSQLVVLVVTVKAVRLRDRRTSTAAG